MPTVAYAELHCRTNFSFLEGASHPHELVERAAELGYAALAVTDRDSVAGVVRAHVAAKDAGLKLLIGASVTPIDGPPMLLWVVDRAGYGRLARLLTLGRRSAPKGECRLTFNDIASHSTGLLAGVLLSSLTSASDRNPHAPREEVPCGRDVFGDRCYAVAELHRGSLDRHRLNHLRLLARDARLPLVAANDHYHAPAAGPTRRSPRCGTAAPRRSGEPFPNAERHLKSPEEMAELFAATPDAVARTMEAANRRTFSSTNALRLPGGTRPADYPVVHLTT